MNNMLYSYLGTILITRNPYMIVKTITIKNLLSSWRFFNKDFIFTIERM